jgi:uncharacterized membrane protein YsdA (DUF1294 family)
MLARFRGVFGSRPYLYGVLSALAMFITDYVVDNLMVRMHLRPEETILNDLLLGGLVGLLVVTLELQHKREMRRQQERLKVVIELNHHIRNALQAIVYINSKMNGEDAAIMREATGRIEWALTEILPGENARSITLPLGPRPTRH